MGHPSHEVSPFDQTTASPGDRPVVRPDVLPVNHQLVREKQVLGICRVKGRNPEFRVTVRMRKDGHIGVLNFLVEASEGLVKLIQG